MTLDEKTLEEIERLHKHHKACEPRSFLKYDTVLHENDAALISAAREREDLKQALMQAHLILGVIAEEPIVEAAKRVKEDNTRLRELLLKIEWGVEGYYCPACDGSHPDYAGESEPGHTKDYPLAAALGER
jgi:hypothetical protein